MPLWLHCSHPVSTTQFQSRFYMNIKVFQYGGLQRCVSIQSPHSACGFRKHPASATSWGFVPATDPRPRFLAMVPTDFFGRNGGEMGQEPGKSERYMDVKASALIFIWWLPKMRIVFFNYLFICSGPSTNFIGFLEKKCNLREIRWVNSERNVFSGSTSNIIALFEGDQGRSTNFYPEESPMSSVNGEWTLPGMGSTGKPEVGHWSVYQLHFFPAMFCGGDRSTVGYMALIYARHQGRSEWINSHGVSKDNDTLQNCWLCLNLLLSMSSVTLRIPQVTWSQQIHLDPLVDDFPALDGLSNCQVAKGYSP